MIKLTFLGVASALSEGYNSNMLLDTNNGKTLLLDAGLTLRESLKSADRNVSEIDAIYLSHLHSDHAASMEWLGFYFYYVLKRKPILFIHESLVSDLWAMLSITMSKTKDRYLTLYDYFDVRVFSDVDEFSFVYDGIDFCAKKALHVKSNFQNMYSYSLHACLTYSCITNPTIETSLFFISFDTPEIDYDSVKNCSTIFYDCDVMNLNGVHANYKYLLELPGSIRKKIWLYHYTDLSKYDGKFGDMPDAVADGFAGFVKQGQIFEF